MKILGYLFIFAILIGAFYGFLILKEYARYFIRLLQIKLKNKLDKVKK